MVARNPRMARKRPFWAQKRPQLKKADAGSKSVGGLRMSAGISWNVGATSPYVLARARPDPGRAYQCSSGPVRIKGSRKEVTPEGKDLGKAGSNVRCGVRPEEEKRA